MKLQRDLQMSAIPNPVESEFPKGSLPAKRQLVENVAIDPADLKDEQLESERPRLAKRVPPVLARSRFVLAWQPTWLGNRTAMRSKRLSLARSHNSAGRHRKPPPWRRALAYSRRPRPRRQPHFPISGNSTQCRSISTRCDKALTRSQPPSLPVRSR
jgi:hypothetical protein